ncbi:MAG: UDP-3-O-(3-hydroxymyristoyl)glucosamine N-acyltransferase [Pseudomonadota bacterium]
MIPDKRFFDYLGPLSLAEAAEVAGGALPSGCDGDAAIEHVAALDAETLQRAIVFATSADGVRRSAEAGASLCVTTAAFGGDAPSGLAVLCVSSPRLAFAKIAGRLHRPRATAYLDGEVREQWSADVSARGGAVHPSAVIGPHVSAGQNVVIGPHVVIGEAAQISDGAVIDAGVVLSHCEIGARTHILPGAKIGQAGFGFVESPEGLYRMPQLGRVLVGDDVEIGANATIDRGALADTVIGDGAKIDNLVQIGHNVRVGRHCVIAAQSGVSGSCRIGDGVMMGGQVGLADHLVIGAGAQIAAGAGLMRDVPAGEKWGGRPARLARDWLKETATLSKLAKKKNG